MNWIIFACSAIVFFTTLNILQRKVAVNSEYPKAASVVFNIYGAIFALVIFISTSSYKNFSLPQEPQAWVFLLVACISYAVFEKGRFVAAKLLEASVLSIVSSFEAPIAFFASAILYKEAITQSKLSGAILIFLALMIVSFGDKVRKKISTKGITVAITIFTFLAVAWTLDKKGAFFFSPNVYQLFIWVIPIIFIYLPHTKFKEIKHEFKVGSWKIFILAGVNVIGYFLQLKAFSMTDATNVIPIVQTSILFTVIFGIILLKEKDHILKKIIAAIISLMGAYLLINNH